MAKRSEFYIYKRKKKRGSYWYVIFIDKKTGKEGSAKSIDVLKEELGLGYASRVERKSDAFRIALKALEEERSNKNGMLLSEYCMKFWNYDESEYIKMRNSRKEGSIGKEYAKNMLLFFKKHVFPHFDKTMLLSDVSLSDIEYLATALKAESMLSSGTIQLVLLSLTIPLKEAFRQGLILKNPVENFFGVAKKSSERGYLTKDECKSILDFLSSHEKDYYPSYVLALRLAFYSGMRSGEIRALSFSAFEKTNHSGIMRLNIRTSISPYSGLKGTKGKYERAILVPEPFYEELKRNSKESALCFPSKSGGYISSPTLLGFFRKVLSDWGISEEKQKERKLTFHSIRHSFSTIGKECGISREDRMLALGHRSERVNEVYTHQSDESLLGVYPLTLMFFSKAPSAVRVDELAALPVQKQSCVEAVPERCTRG